MAFSNPFELSSLDGENGFVINGIDADDFSGTSVSGVGDVNGDGIDDLIIGADFADPDSNISAGESYVVFGSDAGFLGSLELSELDGENGFVINGIDAGDRSGYSVSGAGDVNGDGINDLVIGAYRADPNGNSNAGESYVVFGSDSGFSASLELSSLDGANGFVINGVTPSEYSGYSVSSAGDVNGDGIDDLIIGSTRTGSLENMIAGESYVVFGSNNGFSNSLELSELNGSNGFLINGVNSDSVNLSDYSNYSVSGAGDVNGDGIDDFIISANRTSSNGNDSAGESYLVFGSDEGFAASLELSELDGTNGFVLNGIDPFDYSGFSLSSAGDVNGDGIDDLIIGAYLADPNGNDSAGESYVVFGSDSGFSSSLELSSLDGTNGFAINGVEEGDRSGFSVSSAGDINGDGLDDLLIGAYRADPNGNSSAGESYVVFGSDDGFTANFELSSLDGTNGFVINGSEEGDLSGSSVSGVGDVNGDGVDDLLIGANGADPNGNISAGSSSVVFGGGGILGSLDVNINRFQNVDTLGTFLFATEAESESIRSDFPQFEEEGFAFRVAEEPGEELVEIFRFQSVNNPGTFLLVTEEERENINANFSADFVEEGTAFFVLPATSEVGTTLFRFQNTAQPGTFFFADAQERTSILANFPQFVEEGAAFNVAI